MKNGKVWGTTEPLVVTPIDPGEYTSVQPGEYHWFETKFNNAEVLEIYYLEPITDDIIRETVGSHV